MHSAKHSFSSQRGSTLLLATILAVAMAVILVSLLQFAITESRVNLSQRYRIECQFIAEAAVEAQMSKIDLAVSRGIPLNLAGSKLLGKNLSFERLTEFTPPNHTLEVNVHAAVVSPYSSEYIDPADPANQLDPYAGMRIYQSRILVMAEARLRSKGNNRLGSQAMVSSIYVDRSLPGSNFAIFFNDPINWFCGENATIYGPLHSNTGISFGGNQHTYTIYGRVTTPGYIAYLQVPGVNSQPGGWNKLTAKIRVGNEGLATRDFTTGGVLQYGATFRERVTGEFRYDVANPVRYGPDEPGFAGTKYNGGLDPNFPNAVRAAFDGNVLTGAHGVQAVVPPGFRDSDGKLLDMRQLLDLPNGTNTNKIQEAQKYANRSGLVFTVNPYANNGRGSYKAWVLRPATASDTGPRYPRPDPANPTNATIDYVREDVTAVFNNTNVIKNTRLTNSEVATIRTNINGGKMTNANFGGKNQKERALATAWAAQSNTTSTDPSMVSYYDARREAWVASIDVDVGNLRTVIANKVPDETALGDPANPLRHWNGAVYVEPEYTPGDATTEITIPNYRDPVTGTTANLTVPRALQPDAQLPAASSSNYTPIFHGSTDSAKYNSTDLRKNIRVGVRLLNASQVPSVVTKDGRGNLRQQGFTIATPLPITTKGSFNAPGGTTADYGQGKVENIYGSTTTDPETGRNYSSQPLTDDRGQTLRGIPAAIIADAITCVSDQWTDSLSAYDNWNGRPKATTPITLAAAIIVGNVDGRYNPQSSEFGNDGHTSNVTRYLEDLSGLPIRIRGSLSQLFRSRVALLPHYYDGQRRYTPPTNYYSLSALFQAGITPPQIQEGRSARRIEYRILSNQEYANLLAKVTWP